MDWKTERPFWRPVSTTDRTSAKRWQPHSERKPLANDAGMQRPFGGVAGVLDIAELVGAADLLILGGPLLGVDRVGNPDRAPAVGLRRPPV